MDGLDLFPRVISFSTDLEVTRNINVYLPSYFK